MDTEVWVERYETPTWLDHLRVRRRMTVVDREIEDRFTEFHRGDQPPATRYLLAHIPPEHAGRTAEAGGADARHGHGHHHAGIFDHSLPPAMPARR